MLPVLAQFRFPPPQFESGHTLPTTTAPLTDPALQQWLDVSVLAIALGLAAYFTLKRRSRPGLFVLAAFSLIYFGFWREGCVCPIGAIQNVTLALSDPSYGLPLVVLAFFLLPLLATLIAGRGFCAAVCPLGAIQELVTWRPVRVPRWAEHALGLLPWVYLSLAVLYAATGSRFIICEFDPFVGLFRLSGTIGMLLFGGALLVLGLFVGRPYCRYLCPLGAMLRVLSSLARFRVTVFPNYCTQCRLCEDACPYDAINLPAEPPGGQDVR